MSNKFDLPNSTDLDNEDNSPLKELGIINSVHNNNAVDSNEYPEDYIEDAEDYSSYGHYQRNRTDKTTIWLSLTLIFLFCTVFILCQLNYFRGRYEELSTVYGELQNSYNELIQHEELKYWFTLLRNPNKSEIVIETISF